MAFYEKDDPAQPAHYMTLRDYFAGQVLMGIFASETANWFIADDSIEIATQRCYRMADAMMKERAKDD